jgi:type I restriction enzyme R subunit
VTHGLYRHQQRRSAGAGDVCGALGARAGLGERLRLERWTEKEQTKGLVESEILDNVFMLLPTPPFTEAEKQTLATRIYQHVWRQSSAGLFAARAAA